jgi:hypothetical protein
MRGRSAYKGEKGGGPSEQAVAPGVQSVGAKKRQDSDRIFKGLEVRRASKQREGWVSRGRAHREAVDAGAGAARTDNILAAAAWQGYPLPLAAQHQM